MSYILDALKSSDEQRKHLSTESDGKSQKPVPVTAPVVHRDVPWRLSLVVLLFIAALVALLWWTGKLPSFLPPGPAEPGTATPVTPRATPSGDGLTPTELSGVKLVLRRPQPAPPPTAAAKPERPIAVPQPPPVPAMAAVTAAPQAALPTDSTPDPYADLRYLRQMPAEVQRAMPDLHFSVHIYSQTPDARMVKLGDRVLREGQAITPEIRLEAIIPKGVVLQYRDYRFRVPAL